MRSESPESWHTNPFPKGRHEKQYPATVPSEVDEVTTDHLLDDNVTLIVTASGRVRVQQSEGFSPAD